MQEIEKAVQNYLKLRGINISDFQEQVVSLPHPDTNETCGYEFTYTKALNEERIAQIRIWYEFPDKISCQGKPGIIITDEYV